jgi:hypothetical protein
VHVGQSYGVGVYLGNSQNSKHHEISNGVFYLCAQDIRLVAGSMYVKHVYSFASDEIVYIGDSSITEPIEIDGLVGEEVKRAVNARSGTSVTIKNDRGSNPHQFANGWFLFRDSATVTITNSNSEEDVPSDNAVYIGLQNMSSTSVIRLMGNSFGSITPTQLINQTEPRFNLERIGDTYSGDTLRRSTGNQPALEIQSYPNDANSDAVAFKSSIFTQAPHNKTLTAIQGTGDWYAGALRDFVGVQGLGVPGRFTGTQTAVEAAWSTINAGGNPSSAYSFRAKSPTGIAGGTLPVLYGLYIGKQKIPGVTAGYGVYQADEADKNYFAGPTSFGGGTDITKHISATASLDFGPIAANSCSTLTMIVPGAANGNTVSLGIPSALASLTGVNFMGFVSAADTVTVKACNAASAPSSDPAAAIVRADVWQH